MTGPTTMLVEFVVPADISEGLASGSLKACGGTIRNAQGPGSIRALLTEGRVLRQGEVPFDPATLTQAIGHAQTAAQLASGIGVLNLGVSAAGFAMVRQRLGEIAGQLTHALADLAVIKEELAWMSGLQMAVIKGEIDSALDTASRAYRLNDLGLYKEAKTATFKVRRTLHHAMSIMLETRRAVRRHEVFQEFFRASAILAVSEAPCDEALEGAKQASDEVWIALRDMRATLDEFDRQRRDFGYNPAALIELGSEGRVRTAVAAAEMKIAYQQVEGLSGRLILREMLGMTAGAWQAQTAPEGSGVVTCVTPPPGVEIDLTERVRSNTRRREA